MCRFRTHVWYWFPSAGEVVVRRHGPRLLPLASWRRGARREDQLRESCSVEQEFVTSALDAVGQDPRRSQKEALP